MRVRRSRKRIRDKWSLLTIKKKISVFTSVVFLIILLSVLFDIWVVKFSLSDFRGILDENVKSSDFVDAMEQESRCFETYIKNSSEDNKLQMTASFAKTKRAVAGLTGTYSKMSELRYAKIWSIKNGYENYVKQRDYILAMGGESQGYIEELYKIYDMQDYLQDYGRILMRYTLDDGNDIYYSKVQSLLRVPFVVIIMGVFLFGGMISLAKIMYDTLIVPVMNLVHASKEIASNNFFVEDVIAENQDEMGELVKAFNKMKYATGEYISTLEERRKMMDLIHTEEIEKVEMEKHLETANLELLKSQINPHFLFNTLNIIAGMAKLENAGTTEKMIQALSTIFRYGLKTPQNEVILGQELEVVRDYLYLQQMRFGSRIDFEIACKVDKDVYMVPTFSFQPLVENAIIHGISKKEEGGKVIIRIWMREEKLYIIVADTGVGMSKEELERLREGCDTGKNGRIGIGLGNICKRIQGMYPTGKFEIFSRENAGTVVRLIIPQRRWEDINV